MAQGPEEKVAKAKAERGAKRRSKMKVSNIQERTAVIEKLDPEEKSNSLFREEEQPRELKAPPKKKVNTLQERLFLPSTSHTLQLCLQA